MAELKPCPFCGGEAKKISGCRITFIECKKCGAEICKMESDDFEDWRPGLNTAEEAAIEAWNRREGETV